MKTNKSDPKKSQASMSRKLQLAARLFRIMWRILPSSALMYVFGAILETASFVAAIYAGARLSSLIARYHPGVNAHDIWLWMWIGVGMAALATLGFWLMSTARRLLYFANTDWATRTWHETLNHLDIPDFYNEDTRDEINKVGGAYAWQIANFQGQILELTYGILRFVVTAAVVAQITWWIIPILAVLLIPNLLAEARLAKVQWFVWDEEGDTRHVFWGLDYLMRTVASQMEVRSTQAREYITEKLSRLNESFYQKQKHKYSRGNYLLLPAKLLDTIATAIGSAVLLRQFLSGAIALDRYFFLSGALFRVAGSLQTIFGTLSSMQESVLFVDSYFRLTDKAPVMVDKPDAFALDERTVPKIEFRSVSFSYPGHEELVFDKLNLTIEPGEHVALVGENGAGKSTFIKLLLRFYTPTSGAIYIDGVDLQDIAIESWYDHLATLFQEFNRYPLPVQENIEIAKPEFAGDIKRLEAAAHDSNVLGLVKGFPFGWETVLDNSFKKGIEPSGGQWQRVALARAFYRQASVLILDEPTAAIDANAEYEIFNSIFEHFGERTAIIVSHRFSTVRRADTIVVIDKGKIAEKGSHAQLMKQRGMYFGLFSKQAEGYKD